MTALPVRIQNAIRSVLSNPFMPGNQWETLVSFASIPSTPNSLSKLILSKAIDFFPRTVHFYIFHALV